MEAFVNIIKQNDVAYNVAKKIHTTVYGIIQANHSLCVAYHRLLCILQKKSRIDLFNKQSLKNYCLTHNINISILDEEKSRYVYAPEYFGNSDEAKALTVQSPEIYTVKLSNVSIVGGSSFVLKDKWVLYDMFELDEDNRFDLRFGAIVSISDRGEVATKSYNTQGKLIDKGFFLAGFGSFNYYHLTIELMNKFKYIDGSRELDGYPLIVDEIVLAIPQFRALLDALNDTRREIIPIQKSRKYEVAEMVYISDVSWMPINVKGSVGLIDEDCRVSKECIDYLRQKVMRSYDVILSSDLRQKLFLSRKSNYSQRLSNETQVAALFQSYGFKVIYPEELSLKEQVELFARASIVVGTTGAALTNIIYCPPGTTLVSIIPREYNFNVYSTIAYNMGLRALYLDAKILKRGRKISGDTFELDLDDCERFLKDISTGSDHVDERQY